MKSSKSDIEQAIAQLQEIFDPLVKEVEENAELKENQLTKLIAESYKASKHVKWAFANRLAQLHFDHADTINSFLKICPDYPKHIFDRYLPGVPISLERLGAERAIVESILGWKGDVKLDPCAITQPIIIYAPQTVLTDHAYTITGHNFGPPTGSISLVLDNSGANIPITILGWSDSAVKFQVDVALIPTGTPLFASGNLTLQRADTVNSNTGPIHCGVTIGIEYERPHTLLYAENTQSGSGVNSPPHTYTEEHTFTSPVQSPAAMPFIHRLLSNGDVNIDLKSYLKTGPYGTDVGDDEASYETVSGPYFTTNNEREIKVKVTDDYIHYYSIRAAFYIYHPDDEAIPLGWTPT